MRDLLFFIHIFFNKRRDVYVLYSRGVRKSKGKRWQPA